MKFIRESELLEYVKSRPARGGWIEIKATDAETGGAVSRPARGGWIEMFGVNLVNEKSKSSRPARGGWIEIGGCDVPLSAL